jgi:hypothetical protein
MLIATYLIVGTISFAALVLVIAVFGRLIFFQFKRWVLKNRGYVEVEHIGETGIRNYFILKPENFKFDIAGGFFHYIPESITKTGEIFQRYKGFDPLKKPMPPPEILERMTDKQKEKFWDEFNAQKTQVEKFGQLLSKLEFKQEAMTTRWGMPVITYYGDRPDPVMFRELKKQYGAGVIKDMFLRLLFTQRYEDFKKIMLFVAIGGAVISIALVGLFLVMQGVAGTNEQLASTNNGLVVKINECNNYLAQYLNQTKKVTMQNSTMVV